MSHFLSHVSFLSWYESGENVMNVSDRFTKQNKSIGIKIAVYRKTNLVLL